MLLGLSFVSSCSSLTPISKGPSLESFQQKLCLNSEGKGRLTGPQNRSVFSYESLVEETNWKMAFIIPVHGHERLDFSWQVDPKSRSANGVFEGSLAERIKRSVLDSAHQREVKLLLSHWREMEKSLALFMASLQSPEKFCEKQSEQKGWRCHSKELEKGKPLHIEGSFDFLNVRRQLSEHLVLVLRAEQQKDGSFERTNLFLYERPQLPQSRPVLGLELFAQSCER